MVVIWYWSIYAVDAWAMICNMACAALSSVEEDVGKKLSSARSESETTDGSRCIGVIVT